MDPTLIGLLTLLLLAVLLLLGVPVAFSLAFAGIVSIFVLRGWVPLTFFLSNFPFTTVAVFAYVVLPLFILTGHLAFASGISRNAFDLANTWLNRIPGGLAIASVFGCAAFAAVSGASVATAATMGKIAIPEMRRYGYSDALASGCVAAGGTLGILIPPSGVLIIYAIITEVNLGPLLIAGLLPGILTAVIYSIGIYLIAKFKPLHVGTTESIGFSWKERLISLKNGVEILILFIVVMGGIYFGVFTATEASAFGALTALLILVLKSKERKKAFLDGLQEAVATTTMVGLIIVGAGLFSLAITQSKIPTELARYIIGLQLPPWAMLITILFPYLVLGCFLDGISLLFLTLPIVFPLVQALNFNPIWFGILVTKAVEIGCITPPLGLNVYVIKGMNPDIPLKEIFKGCVPFLIMELIIMVILGSFPIITLFLPNTMMG